VPQVSILGPGIARTSTHRNYAVGDLAGCGKTTILGGAAPGPQHARFWRDGVEGFERWEKWKKRLQSRRDDRVLTHTLQRCDKQPVFNAALAAEGIPSDFFRNLLVDCR